MIYSIHLFTVKSSLNYVISYLQETASIPWLETPKRGLMQLTLGQKLQNFRDLYDDPGDEGLHLKFTTFWK